VNRDGDDDGVPRRRGPAARLPTHRAVLALGLLAAGPPLVLHDGWRGAIPAVGAAGYAVYLVAGKRWPLRRRRVTRARPTPGPRPDQRGGRSRTDDGSTPRSGPA